MSQFCIYTDVMESQSILQERGLGKRMSLVAFPKIKAPKLHRLQLGYETGSEDRKILLGSGRNWWNLKALLSQHHTELFSSSFFQSARKVAKSVFFFFFPSTPFSSRLPIFIGRKGRREGEPSFPLRTVGIVLTIQTGQRFNNFFDHNVNTIILHT